MKFSNLGDTKKLSLIERGAKKEIFKIFVFFFVQSSFFSSRFINLSSGQFQRAQNDVCSSSVRGVIIS